MKEKALDIMEVHEYSSYYDHTITPARDVVCRCCDKIFNGRGRFYRVIGKDAIWKLCPECNWTFHLWWIHVNPHLDEVTQTEYTKTNINLFCKMMKDGKK